MTTESGYYVVMYDITHPGTLQKVAKILVQCGMERLNYSVWLGWVNPARQPALKEKLVKLVTADKAAGSLFYILPVALKDVKRMRTITGRKPKELDYWLGEKHTLFF
jgi:CRISPR-associated endonuclease Cas2